MATVRSGHKGVLIVVDVQVGVMKASWDAPRVIANVAQAVQQARAQGVPVVWVQHTNEELARGSDAWQWVPELVPAAGEVLVHKHYNSGFEDTTLDAELARLGATHITLAGAQSNWCIRATAYGALERGYDLTLVEDAHTTESMALPDGSRIDAADVVRELNLGLTWVRYPGRVNGVARAAALTFTPPAAPVWQAAA